MQLSGRLLLLCTACLAALLLLPAPATAHTGFQSSDPADGSVTAGEVGQIVIRFGGAAEPAGEGFVVLDGSGTIRRPDTVTTDPTGTTWLLGFDPPLSPGTVGVRWTVQAPDTHPFSGSFSFTVAASPTAEATPVDRSAGATPVDRSGGAGAARSSGESAVAGADRSSGDTAPVIRSRQLDAFLDTTPPVVPRAGVVEAFGRLLGYGGTMLAIGGTAFAARVVRDRRQDRLSVLQAVGHGGALLVVGAVVDLVGHLATAGGGWGSVWSPAAAEAVSLSSSGLATGLRIVAGLLVVTTARMELGPHTPSGPARPAALAAIPVPALAGPGPVDAPQAGGPAGGPRVDRPAPAVDRRTGGARPSPMLLVAISMLLASFTFDGHTVTEGNRWLTGAVDVVHVLAAAIWAGGIAAFAVVLWHRQQRGVRLEALELALRFSAIAGGALALAGLAGTILAVTILDGLAQLWSTPWGLLLVAKFAAVCTAAALGAYNHFVVIPWLAADPADGRRSIRLRNTVTGEAAVLLAVVAITGLLAGAASQ